MYYSMIDSLYSGELRPGELMPASARIRDCGREFEELSGQFRENLCPKQQAIFDEVIHKHTALWDCDSRDMFYTGFCMGSRIMMEVMKFEER